MGRRYSIGLAFSIGQQARISILMSRIDGEGDLGNGDPLFGSGRKGGGLSPPRYAIVYAVPDRGEGGVGPLRRQVLLEEE